MRLKTAVTAMLRAHGIIIGQNNSASINANGKRRAESDVSTSPDGCRSQRPRLSLPVTQESQADDVKPILMPEEEGNEVDQIEVRMPYSISVHANVIFLGADTTAAGATRGVQNAHKYKKYQA